MKRQRIKLADIQRQYQPYPSFSDRLSWHEWSDTLNLMLLEDGCSVGAVLELSVLATENLTAVTMDAIAEKLKNVLTQALPLHDSHPWVAQVFLQAEQSLVPLLHRMREYINEKNSASQNPQVKIFIEKYLALHARHFKLMSDDNGLFIDPMSNLPFQGNIRRVRLVLYRRVGRAKIQERNPIIQDCEARIATLTSQLEQAGISVSRLEGKHVYEWWLRWFNPNPALTDGDVDTLVASFPYPTEKPLGWTFSESCFRGTVEANEKEGIKFDGLSHKVLVFAPLETSIPAGVISAERQFGAADQSRRYALFDKCPPGSVYTLQMVFESKKIVNQHLTQLEKAAVGQNLTIKEVVHNIERARHEMNENNHLLIRCTEAIYIRENAKASIDDVENTVRSLFLESGLVLYDSQHEPFLADSYLRFLPFNFCPEFDAKYTYRATYKYAIDVAKLLPVYGRSHGDGRFPLLPYFNRGGEPFIFDFLNREFKMANSHLFIVGSTGAGKSVTLNQLCLALMAVYRPHIVALEVGNSLGLTARYIKGQGFQSQSVRFELHGNMPVNPYADWQHALRHIRESEKTLEELSEHYQDDINSQYEKLSNPDVNEDDYRDVLNEMVLATRIMLTRGDSKEEAAITLIDMTFIAKALKNAMLECEKNNAMFRVEHVAASFHALSLETHNSIHAARLEEFHLRLQYYLQDPVRSRFLNRPSATLELQDFLHIDFGFMQQESYQDLLNIVCISLLSKILALAEANKGNARPIILIIDEVHVLLKSKMVAAFLVLMAKVSRKLGLWLVLSTQNIGDLSETDCVKALSMIETWLCLSLEPHEIALIEKFKTVSPETKAQLLDLRKYPGFYSEAFLYAKRFCGILRNVPPRLYLALAMTEQDERAARLTVQTEQGLSELEAVEWIAAQLETIQASKTQSQQGFLWGN